METTITTGPSPRAWEELGKVWLRILRRRYPQYVWTLAEQSAPENKGTMLNALSS